MRSPTSLSRATNLHPLSFSRVHAGAHRVRRLLRARRSLGEILGTLAENTPEHHGCSAHASDLPERLKQHSDVESSEECIETDERLMATSEAAPEVLPSMMHGGLATN
jgi:hypothetical protein